METRQRLRAHAALLHLILLSPVNLLSQRPPAPGKLAVNGPKGAKAPITIDGRDTRQVTDHIFNVSPGQHSVSLSSGSPPGCQTAKSVTVQSGSTVSLTCTANGWTDRGNR
jgi:hypothetical protein